MPQKKPYALARYVNEATKKPFELIVDDKKSIIIEQPDGETMMVVDQAANSEEAMRLLVGDKYDEIMKVFGSEPGGALRLLTEDIKEHFDLGG
jgi:hypothetical protein